MSEMKWLCTLKKKRKDEMALFILKKVKRLC